MKYKFVKKNTRRIVFAFDGIGFILWIILHVFMPWKIWRKTRVFERPKRILLIRVDYIGDVLLTTHTLSAIRERFSGANITFLTSSKSREIVEGNPYIDTVLTYDPPWFFKKTFFQAFREYFHILLLLRKEKFDLAADFRGDVRNILLLMVFSSIPYRVSFAASGGWYLLTSLADYRESLHESEYHTIIAETLGAKIDKNLLPQIFVTDKDRIFISNFLNKNGVKEDDMLVVIHPGARQVVRRWPESRYAEVGRYLMAQYGAKIILTGSPDELPLIERVKKSMNDEAIIGATEIRSFKQLTALFEKCSLYIGVSSGPSHMAGIANLPSVLIFGPESVSQWYPLGNKYYIVQKNFPCCPCNQKGCSLKENCIESVKAEDVICGIDILLNACDDKVKYKRKEGVKACLG